MNDYLLRQATADFERELFDPYADELDAEELDDIADEIGNAQFDAWHENQ